MSISSGSRVGPYEVQSLIGAGGMGEVYRALDTKLNRSVALKMLPASLDRDVERLSRFRREAQVLASLNHPHIAQIYGFEDSGGAHALVMELVEGPTLADRLAQGAMPIDEAVAVARQIVAALEAAHEQGIVHRDLKPANIKVRRDGEVKVLDFGLAKAMEPASAAGPQTSAAMNSPTLSLHATHAGIILGTAAYMSPEQAAGRPVDKRADIWSFGVVLWEMLAGRSLFGGGESVSHILADVLRAPVDFEAVPAGPLRQLVQRCLDRDGKTRLRDIGEARVALASASLSEPAPGSADVRPVEASAKSPYLWMAATALMALAAAVASWGWLGRPGSTGAPHMVTHFTTIAPQGVGANPVAVSPDGSRLAFSNTALSQIFVRAMDDPIAKPVPGTDDGKMPTFSPDGQSLAFLVGSTPPFQLKKIPVAGGAALTLAEVEGAVPMTWGDDGNILVGGPVLQRVADAGGKPTTIAKVDASRGELTFASPQLLPDGRHILASIVTGRGLRDFRVVIVDVNTGDASRLLEGIGEVRFVPSGSVPELGHLVYAFSGSLFAAAFNTATLQVGTAVPVLEDLRNLGGLTHIGFSKTGTIAYAGRDSAAFGLSTLVWTDRRGVEQALTAPPRFYSNPRVSPDGRRVAVQIFDASQALDNQLWVHDLARGVSSRVTFDRNNAYPVWSADGKRLIYMSSPNVANSNGVLASVAADGSGPPSTLMATGPIPAPTSVSADGKWVIGVRARSQARSGTDVWVMPLDGAATPQPFLDNRFTRGELQFSPDGKWVAYESSESGRNEIYVAPFPGPGGRTQVSSDGGAQPRWNRNGRELFFRSGATVMAVDVETGSAFRAGSPKTLFEKTSVDYDVAPDGTRFLMLKSSAPASGPAEVHVIVNWFDDLRRRVPLPK